MNDVEELKWQVAEDAYELALRVLKDVEKFNIPTSNNVTELQHMWHMIVPSELVFSRKSVRSIQFYYYFLFSLFLIYF